MDYAGKNIIITGGAGGICSELAREFLRQGAQHIGLLDVADPNNIAVELQKEFIEKTVTFFTVDVRERDQLKNAFSQFVEKFGYVDIVIGGAGVLNEFTPENTTIAINLMGIINTTYEAIEWMSTSKKGRGGLIANIASTGGIIFCPYLPIYCASKHGVIGFTKSMANETNKNLHGIEFSIICPAVTDTSMPKSNIKERLPPDFAENALKLFDAAIYQTPSELAVHICRVLKTGKNGAIWVVQGNKCVEYIPSTYTL